MGELTLWLLLLPKTSCGLFSLFSAATSGFALLLRHEVECRTRQSGRRAQQDLVSPWQRERCTNALQSQYWVRKHDTVQQGAERQLAARRCRDANRRPTYIGCRKALNYTADNQLKWPSQGCMQDDTLFSLSQITRVSITSLSQH